MGLNILKAEKTTPKTSTLPGSGVKVSKLEDIVASLNSKYGVSMAVTGDPKPQNMPRIPCSNPEINKALGGGVPIGKILEIYGPESSGKTTFCLDIASQAQRMGMNVAFIDAEHALDQLYASNLGVDIPNTLIVQPDCGEDALNSMKDIMDQLPNTLFILDSIAALVPRADLEGENAEIGKSNMGSHARLMSSAYKQLLAKVKKTGSTLLLTNQMRLKIGVVYGSPITTSGGEATKYYASIRIQMGKDIQIMDGEKPVGQRSKFKIIKNKTSPIVSEFTVDIIYGKGFDNTISLVRMAKAYGVLNVSGTWYSFEGNNIGQGEQNVKSNLETNPDLMKQVVDKLEVVSNDGKTEMVVAKKEKKKK